MLAAAAKHRSGSKHLCKNGSSVTGQGDGHNPSVCRLLLHGANIVAQGHRNCPSHRGFMASLIGANVKGMGRSSGLHAAVSGWADMESERRR